MGIAIVVGNLFVVSLLVAYYKFGPPKKKPWSWKEYCVMLGTVILFNAYAFVYDDFGYVLYFVGMISLAIGFYSGADP